MEHFYMIGQTVKTCLPKYFYPTFQSLPNDAQSVEPDVKHNISHTSERKTVLLYIIKLF